ncbi:hypothetical protein ACFXTH_015177 [Malus domestica]
MKLHAEKKRSRKTAAEAPSSQLPRSAPLSAICAQTHQNPQSLLSGSQNPLGFDGSSASCGCGVAVLREGELQKWGEKKETRRGMREKVRGIGGGGNTGKWGVCVYVSSGKERCRKEMGGRTGEETRRGKVCVRVCGMREKG